jgi:hypothetical protein
MFETYGNGSLSCNELTLWKHMEIRWPCSSRLIRAAGRHYARHVGHAACSSSGLLQHSPQEPHWPSCIPYTALRCSAVGLRTVGSHKTGTCLAQIFIGAETAGCHPRLSCSSASDGGRRGRGPARSALFSRWPPLSLPLSPAWRHQSLWLPPVVRIAGQSGDRARAGRSSEVVPWCP